MGLNSVNMSESRIRQSAPIVGGSEDAGLRSMLAYRKRCNLAEVKPDVLAFGIGQGGAFTLPPLVLGKLFGTKLLGELLGLYLVATVLGSVLGAPLTGAIRDATGDYTVPLICLAVAAFLGSLCASLIRHEEGQL